VRTVSVAADPEPTQLIGTDHVDHGHSGLYRHPGRERGGVSRRVQVVVPLVVANQLRQGVKLEQQLVQQRD